MYQERREKALKRLQRRRRRKRNSLQSCLLEESLHEDSPNDESKEGLETEGLHGVMGQAPEEEKEEASILEDTKALLYSKNVPELDKKVSRKEASMKSQVVLFGNIQLINFYNS